MPTFLETINIADFIPVLNRSLENNKSLIYAGHCGVTQPVKFLTSETRLSVFGNQSLSERSY